MASVVIIILVSLILSAFFSGMEIAFVSANKLKLEIDKKQGGAFNRIVDIFVRRPGQYITTILVGNNISLVVYSLFMTRLFHLVAARHGIPVGDGSIILETIVSTLIIIFTAEYTPKAIVKLNPNFYLRIFVVPIYVCYILLYPIAKFSTLLSMGLLRLAGLPVRRDQGIRGFDRVDLEHLVEESTESETGPDNDIRIFQNALDFPDLRVRDCMVPRVDVEAVDVAETIDELADKFIESKYSRIFVWEGSIDNIIGYVNSKSLFRNPTTIREIIKEVLYVTETMPLQKLLHEFIRRKSSLAVVIDEFGGTAGIISLEDILEEIFGEIDDEHDTPDLVEKVIGDREYVFSCRLEVEYLNEKYDLRIEESEEYDTLAGYIIYHEQGIPPVGTTITIDNKSIKILKSSSSRLELARVRIL